MKKVSTVCVVNLVARALFFNECVIFSIEFDEELANIEQEIQNIATSRQSNIPFDFDVDNIVSKTIGYFVSDKKKFIRCIVKANDRKGIFFLWAPDYGVPFIGYRSEIIELPSSIQEMRINRKIHCGGMLNCMPAVQSSFDLTTGDVRKIETSGWSTHTTNKFGEILKSFVAFKFLKVYSPFVCSTTNEEHQFGQLMVQVKNGTWHNAKTALFTLQGVEVPEDYDLQFEYIFKEFESIRCEIWRNMENNEFDQDSEDSEDSDDSILKIKLRDL